MVALARSSQYASSFTYAEAVWSQKLPDWIAAHVRAFAYFGGVPRQTVSDNLKAGITKACFHEPMANRTYADMAWHYGTARARPYKPRDKAKVEVGVQVVGRWVLARLRHRRFFSLTELNAAIRAVLEELNGRPMRGWGTSRRALFEKRKILPSVEHRQSRYLNNRAEVSHQPTRRRERQMKRFQSARHAQRFLSTHSRIHNHFQLRRHHLARLAMPPFAHGAMSPKLRLQQLRAIISAIHLCRLAT
jgi:hypothetical protein